MMQDVTYICASQMPLAALYNVMPVRRIADTTSCIVPGRSERKSNAEAADPEGDDGNVTSHCSSSDDADTIRRRLQNGAATSAGTLSTLSRNLDLLRSGFTSPQSSSESLSPKESTSLRGVGILPSPISISLSPASEFSIATEPDLSLEDNRMSLRKISGPLWKDLRSGIGR